MAKLKIVGCGYCSKSKGCEIKKNFRNLAKELPEYEMIKYSSGLSDYRRPFEMKLKCDFVDRKFKENDKVKFTIGIKRYKKIFDWECHWDCDSCHPDNRRCDKNGIVQFENIRYAEYLEIEGTIMNYYRNGKYVISVDHSYMYKMKYKFNDLDIEFIDKLSSAMSGHQFNKNNPMYSMDDFVFISKQKFIKPAVEHKSD